MSYLRNKNEISNSKGITLIALIVTIIVIIILAGISITEGNSLIKKVKVENAITNMITIKAKAKVYAEEVNAEVWDVEDKAAKRKELFSSKYDMTEVEDKASIISKVDSEINDENGCECYNITKKTLTNMGLSELSNDTQNGEYVVVYNSADYTKLEVVYPSGIAYEGQTFYTLSTLQEKINE